MLVYVPEITERLKYTFGFILHQVLGLEFSLSSSISEFEKDSSSMKWSYGKKVGGCPYLPAYNLLFEKEIKEQNPQRVSHDDLIGFFGMDDHPAEFDVIACVFYLISRYEEYLPCVKDSHGRYAAYQSLAVKGKFLETAMVNRYIEWMRTWLNTNFSTLEIQKPKPKILFSFDVDHPFYAKEMNLEKLVLRKLKSWKEGDRGDRYDTFDFILNELNSLPSIFFFLCPESPTEHDNFNKRDSEAFRNLILKISEKSKLGIHPSYRASSDKKLLNNEIHWLSGVRGNAIKSSRYHYLRNDIEKSYKELITEGIQFDFSMAYGDHSGFRSSTSFPFYYFDLKKNRATNLLIYTPCIMDSCFAYGYQEGFEEKYASLWKEVRNYGGVYMPIFHNDILAQPEWKEKFMYSINLLRSEIPN